MPKRISRRTAVKALALGAVSAVAPKNVRGDEAPSAERPVNVISVTGEPHPELRPFDELMTSFLSVQGAPGAALAVTRKGRLVYARGFGLADAETARPVQPDSLFRIASISKPLTAVAVMQLVEAGKLSLELPVFDVLSVADWLPSDGKFDERLKRITIRQLLQHTAGWDRSVSFDPIVKARDMSRVLGRPLPMGPSDVVRYTLTLPLDFDPGTRYAYANVDYLLLGRLIERTSGRKYEAYVKENVLAPVGATRTQLGRAWRDDLAEGEVRYYDSKQRSGPAVNGSKLDETVPLVYGAENFEAYEAHGGWISSAIDLVRFASALDPRPRVRLLKRKTIATMFTRPEGLAGHDAEGKPKDFYYGCGWNVRPIGDTRRANTWHSGLIAGTSTILVRRHDGLNWAVLFNTDANAEGKTLSGLIDPLVHKAADAVTSWPDRDLFS